MYTALRDRKKGINKIK